MLQPLVLFAVTVPFETPLSNTVTLLAGSASPETVTVALFVIEALAGALMNGAAGAVTSTVHVRVAGVASRLPAESIAVTVKLCLPSLRPV